MAVISEKYVAGLFDSDGHINWSRIREGVNPRFNLCISQLAWKSEVLEMLKGSFGGTVYYTEERNPNESAEWKLSAQESYNLLRRIHKYLVIKRDYIEWALSMIAGKLEIDSKEFNRLRKEKRDTRTKFTHNYPTTKWLAGYFDGDGTVGVSNINKDNTAIIRFSVTAHKKDSIGIELIQKAFGGRFTDTSKDRTCYQWTLYLSASNSAAGIKFLEHFSDYCVIKKDQLLAVKQYLNAELKNGSELDKTLRLLKQPPAETK